MYMYAGVRSRLADLGDVEEGGERRVGVADEEDIGEDGEERHELEQRPPRRHQIRELRVWPLGASQEARRVGSRLDGVVEQRDRRRG